MKFLIFLLLPWGFADSSCPKLKRKESRIVYSSYQQAQRAFNKKYYVQALSHLDQVFEFCPDHRRGRALHKRAIRGKRRQENWLVANKKARNRMRNKRQIKRLLREADKLIKLNELENARDAITEALIMEPKNGEAMDLLKIIKEKEAARAISASPSPSP